MKNVMVAIALALCALPAHADETYLDVRFNGRKAIQATSVEFDEVEPGVLAAAPSVWLDLGLLLSEDEKVKSTLTTTDLGLTVAVDMSTMVADLRVPAGRLPIQVLGVNEVAELPTVSPSAKGALIAYDVAVAYNPKSGVAASLGHEIRATVGSGVLSTTGQLNVSKAGAQYVRGYTTWTLDIPDKRLSIQVGDIQTQPTGPSSSVGMAGVRIASDPTLDTTRPTFPVPLLGGVAASPSKAQAYINGSPLQPYDVEAGGFAYGNVGLSGGLNVGDVVLTDAYGRQTSVSSRFYVSTDQLRKGLSRWEVNAGLVRQGLTNTYTTPAFSASIARGMTDKWTMEGHVEGTKDAHNASLGSKLVLGNYGALGLTYGKSSSDKGSGTAMGVDYSFNSRNWSAGLSYLKQTDNWWELSRETGSSRGALDAKTIWGSVRMGDHITMAGSMSRVQEGGFQRNRSEIRMDWSRNPSFLSASIARDGKDNQVRLTYTRPIGSVASSIDLSHSDRGNRAEVRLSGDRDTKMGDMRWTTRVGSSMGTRYGSAAARWDNPKFDANARIDAYGSDRTISAGYRSAIWIGEGVRQQSKSQGSSLAVVKVAGVEGVPVYLENKLVGKTNASGVLVVGPVHQLVINHLRIDERALPLGMEVASTTMEAVPNRNHVALVEYKLKSMDARTFTVKLTDGSYPSLGAALTTDSETAIVGYDGGIYLETPKAGEVITITHDRGVCSASVPTPLPTFDETVELECK